MGRLTLRFGLASALAFVLAPALAARGVSLDGSDLARVVPPSQAQLEPYSNNGYSLQVVQGDARVEVRLDPIGSKYPFALPVTIENSEFAELAQRVTARARTRYEASGRILAWVSENIRYKLERSEGQEAAAVLARRTGFCTGIARLTVRLLEAVGISAREVAGYVADAELKSVAPSGYHRWIEIHYPDTGWMFSDPLVSHHYVPATYVRLAGENLDPSKDGKNGLLLSRVRRLVPVDVDPRTPPGVSSRRNRSEQYAGTLRIHFASARVGSAVLVGMGKRYTHRLQAGECVFVGLDPGVYELQVSLPGNRRIERRVDLTDRLRRELYLR